tara:strand:+ start:352 stop:564 length:213 start_codon:yes stop_codon:yes gene_type:complete
MFRKIVDAAAILGLILSAGLAGGSYFLYKYVQSPQFEAQVKNKLMGDIKKAIPKAIDAKLPTTTGLGLPK